MAKKKIQIDDMLGGETVITTMTRLHQSFNDEVGKNVNILIFIRMLNRLLSDMRITKPAENISKIYFCNKFKKYPLPDGFRDPIGIRYGDSGLLSRVTPAILSQYQSGEMYALQNNNGKLYTDIIHNNYSGGSVIITNCESLTADGTWTAGSGVSNIALNSNTKHQGNNSVGFDITGTQATITFVRTNVIDASSYTEHQGFGLYQWLPTKPSSVVMRWGNDDSNYYEQTLTTQANGEEFITTDENELRTDRNSATETGSVDNDNIDWFQVEYNFSSTITDTDFLIDYPILFKPDILNLEYYTSYLAKNSDGVLLSIITENADTTDIPFVYDEYLQTILDGLCWRYFLKKDKELADKYRGMYEGRYAPSRALIGGLRYLLLKYPDRTQKVRNVIRLPQL